MTIIPNKRQWNSWSTPSKLTAIGTFLALLSLFLYAIDKIYTDELVSSNVQYVEKGAINTIGDIKAEGGSTLFINLKNTDGITSNELDEILTPYKQRERQIYSAIAAYRNGSQLLATTIDVVKELISDKEVGREYLSNNSNDSLFSYVLSNYETFNLEQIREIISINIYKKKSLGKFRKDVDLALENALDFVKIYKNGQGTIQRKKQLLRLTYYGLVDTEEELNMKLARIEFWGDSTVEEKFQLAMEYGKGINAIKLYEALKILRYKLLLQEARDEEEKDKLLQALPENYRELILSSKSSRILPDVDPRNYMGYCSIYSRLTITDSKAKLEHRYFAIICNENQAKSISIKVNNFGDCAVRIYLSGNSECASKYRKELSLTATTLLEKYKGTPVLSLNFYKRYKSIFSTGTISPHQIGELLSILGPYNAKEVLLGG